MPSVLGVVGKAGRQAQEKNLFDSIFFKKVVY